MHKFTRTFLLANALETESYTKPGNANSQLNFSYVEFILRMERFPQFYINTVALPSTMITILALFSFWLPPSCGEKLSFGVSLLLGLSVFQLVVADQLPDTSQGQPLLKTYLSMNFIMVGVSLFLNLITVTVNSSQLKIKHPGARRVILNLPSRSLCIGSITVPPEDEDNNKYKTAEVVCKTTIVNELDSNLSEDMEKVSRNGGYECKSEKGSEKASEEIIKYQSAYKY